MHLNTRYVLNSLNALYDLNMIFSAEPCTIKHYGFEIGATTLSITTLCMPTFSINYTQHK
jgi:hypothetical protein